MSKDIDYRIIYNRRGKLDKNGKAPVVIVAYHPYQNPDRRHLPTGVRLEPAEWDHKKKQVKGNTLHNATLNKRLADYRNFEYLTRHTQGQFTLADFDRMPYLSKQGPQTKPLSFTSFMQQEIDKAKRTLSTSAYFQYSLTVKLLLEFNKSKAVEFKDLTYSFIREFDDFLITTRKYVDSTKYKHHQRIGQYFKVAANMEIVSISKNPYNNIKYKKGVAQKDVLYPIEISRIERLVFSEEQKHLEIYRDAFLFSIYTLLRIGDVTSLRPSKLIREEKGVIYEGVSQKTRKTNKKHRLPLFDLHRQEGDVSKPEKILNQYMPEGNTPLFNCSHPKLNKHVKTIASMAGITKHVTFHTARHSGITWLVILGLELPFIRRLAQHSSIVTTMQYVHLADIVAGERLSQINWEQRK